MKTTIENTVVPFQLLNKVPEVTLFFWIIKVLCTTVGETAADYLNVNLNLGLTGTSIVTGVLLVIALALQFKAKEYVPGTYWLAVTFVSVFGTLVTDNLTDKMGLPLETSTLIFGVLLALTFLAWYVSEKTLSIHSIFTRRREVFYWFAILFTFALGTASGDLMAEGLGLGYLTTGFIVAGVITVIALAWKLRMNPVLSFWIIYIMTRPLGASLGDYLSQPQNHGGLGLGATVTSVIFLGGILATVVYLSITRKDVIGKKYKEETIEDERKGGLWQTAVVLALFVMLGGAGYHIRHTAIAAETTASSPITETKLPAPASTGSATAVQPAPASPLGDLSLFRTITEDTLSKLNAGDQSGAKKRIGDLEFEWDNAQSHLKAKDKTAWTNIDKKIDVALRELRAVHPDPTSEKDALQALLAELG
ncbi:MAG: hypothetical protein WCJ56_04540 [bacterium]